MTTPLFIYLYATQCDLQSPPLTTRLCHWHDYSASDINYCRLGERLGNFEIGALRIFFSPEKRILVSAGVLHLNCEDDSDVDFK